MTSTSYSSNISQYQYHTSSSLSLYPSIASVSLSVKISHPTMQIVIQIDNIHQFFMMTCLIFLFLLILMSDSILYCLKINLLNWNLLIFINFNILTLIIRKISLHFYVLLLIFQFSFNFHQSLLFVRRLILCFIWLN